MVRENRRLGQKVEILKDPYDVCECIISLYSFNISKEKIDQVISVVLSKLTKKDSLVLLIYFEHESSWHHHVSELDFNNTDSLIFGEVKL